MVLGVRTPGRVGRRRSLATKERWSRTGVLRAFPGVACSDASAAITTPAPLWPTRTATAPAGRSGGASRRPAAPARHGRPTAAPMVDAVAPQVTVHLAPPRWRRTPGRSSWRSSRRPPETVERAGTSPRRRGSRRLPSEPRAPDRARRGAEPNAGSSRPPRRRARHRGPAANRAPRPNGVPPRSASGAVRGRHATRPIEQARIEERTLETWIDEGSVRAEAVAAARRATTDGPRQRRAGADPPRSGRRVGDHRSGRAPFGRAAPTARRPPRRRSTVSGTTRPIGSSRR